MRRKLNLDLYPNLKKAGIFLSANGKLDISKSEALKKTLDEVLVQREKKRLLSLLENFSDEQLKGFDQLVGKNLIQSNG